MAATTLTGVWSSPLLRARQTAEALASARGSTVTISEALREFDCGDLEGRTDAPTWDQHMQILRTWLLEGSFGARLPGGESALEVCDRLTALVSQLTALYGASEAEVALVGHAGLFAVALPFLVPRVSHSFAWAHPVRKAGHVVVSWSHEGMRCLSWDGIEFSASA
jgi:broad specificity phosphatase PhoE